MGREGTGRKGRRGKWIGVRKRGKGRGKGWEWEQGREESPGKRKLL